MTRLARAAFVVVGVLALGAAGFIHRHGLSLLDLMGEREPIRRDPSDWQEWE